MRIGKKNNALLKTLANYKHSLKSPTKWKLGRRFGIWNVRNIWIHLKKIAQELFSFGRNTEYQIG